MGVNIKTGWSVDPFGHGPTVPYLLRKSEVTGGTVIQRIHYAWKEWFARTQNGDFMWRQNWDRTGHTDTLVHNMPFDIYSIRGSCGPHPQVSSRRAPPCKQRPRRNELSVLSLSQVCLNFDFRKIPGEFTDYSELAVPIDDQNKMQKADLLMEQYGRTASMSPYNVALVPLGDDFRYDHDVEWDQQYRNYQKLFEHINGNADRYHGAEVRFGTPSDFFRAVRERSDGRFPTLRGDFFVYGDVYSEGRPAYWSGYYTTRPYWKTLDRELEASLRSTEMLYTVAVNDARRNKQRTTAKLLERNYEKLTRARQNLALFQHHDAITGTSKAFVMDDYALKLFEGMQDCAAIQSHAVQCLLSKAGLEPSARIVMADTDRQTYDRPAYRLALNVDDRSRPRHVIVFNPHGRRRTEPVRTLVSSAHVRVLDSDGRTVRHQINPVWNASETDGERPLAVSAACFELLFVAVLEPLSLTTFVVQKAPRDAGSVATVRCKNCAGHSVFAVRPMRLGDVQLENARLRAVFDGKTGLLKTIVDKSTGRAEHVHVDFAAYQSAQFHSGAYLFMPDPNMGDTEKRVLDDYPGGPSIVLVTSGPLSTEITVVYRIVTHTVRLYHGEGVESRGLYVENTVDFERPPKNRETELFMRLSSGIGNGDPAVIYTDSNGFQMQRRVTVKRVGVEGNYHPATSAAYIEDDRRRLTVLVNHAQGVLGWEPGRIELMLDRRTLYDDSRGMGEGVVDNKMTLTKYWILLETVSAAGGGGGRGRVSNPSLAANQLSEGLMYPANVFVVEPGAEHLLRAATVAMLDSPMPCDVHLMNVRTTTDPVFQQFPSRSALMVIHRKGYDCRTDGGVVPECLLRRDKRVFDNGTVFAGFRGLRVAGTTLTGLHRLQTFDRLDQVQVAPMELSVFNVTFSD